MNQEQKIIYYREILLDETKTPNERINAQRRLFELLEIKEDQRGEKIKCQNH